VPTGLILGLAVVVLIAAAVWSINELRVRAKVDAAKKGERIASLEEVNDALLAYQRGERGWRDLTPEQRREHRRRMRRELAKRRSNS
jgi:acyl-CoA reductase-like NAD-dependent aldehyde dehydrogenase